MVKQKQDWKLHYGDCMEHLPRLAAGSVDAFVTDPPYLIGAISTGDPKSKAGSWTDLMNASYWYAAWMGHCWRALKDGGFMVVFLNWRSSPMILKACADARIRTSSLAVWDKEWIGPASNDQLRPTYEMMLFCGKGKARIPNRSQSDILRCKWMAAHSKESTHPAEKPVELVRRVVGLVAKPGSLIIDPFTGSGTTAIAAVSEGCRFVGWENDADRFKEGTARISTELKVNSPRRRKGR